MEHASPHAHLSFCEFRLVCAVTWITNPENNQDRLRRVPPVAQRFAADPRDVILVTAFGCQES